MQPHRLFPLIAALLLLPTAGLLAGDSAPGQGQVSMDQMDAQAREAWVQTRLQWLDEANAAVLSPEAVKLQHARFEKMLGDFVEDRDGWQDQVKEFEDELALSQRAAIEHLTRRYRIDAYRSFRGDRSQYDQRRHSLATLLERSRKSTAPDGERYKIVSWLVAATADEVADGKKTLPRVPDFLGSEPESTPRPVVADSEAAEPLPAPVRRPVAERAPVAAVEAAPLSESRQPVTLIPSTEPSPRRVVEMTPSELVRPQVLLTAAMVELPTGVHQSRPRPHHVAIMPSMSLPAERRVAAEAPKPSVLAASTRVPWRRPPSVASVTRPNTGPAPTQTAWSPASSTSDSDDPLAFARTSVDRVSMASSPANYGHRGSDTASLLASPSTGGSGASTSSPASKAGPTKTLPDPMTSANPLAEVNMDELASQITGNNLALRKLAARLCEEREWNADALTVIMDQLAPLIARKDGLKLIRECVPKEKLANLGKLETGSDLISDVGAKIDRARARVKGDSFKGSNAERRAQLAQLKRLSERLANLVFND